MVQIFFTSVFLSLKVPFARSPFLVISLDFFLLHFCSCISIRIRSSYHKIFSSFSKYNTCQSLRKVIIIVSKSIEFNIKYYICLIICLVSAMYNFIIKIIRDHSIFLKNMEFCLGYCYIAFNVACTMMFNK